MALLISGLVGTGLLSIGYITTRSVIGGCQKVSLQDNFNVTAYLGLWFEFQRSDNIPFESGTCVTANYTVMSDGYVNVVNSQYFNSTNITD